MASVSGPYLDSWERYTLDPLVERGNHLCRNQQHNNGRRSKRVHEILVFKQTLLERMPLQIDASAKQFEEKAKQERQTL